MRSCAKWFVLTLGTMVCLAMAGATTWAQDNRHVVSLDELNKDAAQPAAKRQADEAAVRELLSSEAGQKALKSTNIGYQEVDKAIGRLSDEDLADVAARSRQAESDFAAGGLGSRLLVVIILIVVLIVVLALVF